MAKNTTPHILNNPVKTMQSLTQCRKVLNSLAIVLLVAALVACDKPAESNKPASASAALQNAPEALESTKGGDASAKAELKAYFGDLHVHTMYSFDAFIFGTTASPDDAYRFARGQTLKHPGGFDMQLQEPLDFYGVTDHAFYLGALRAMTDPTSNLFKHELARGMENFDNIEQRRTQFNKILNWIRSDRSDELLDQTVFKTAWDDIIAAANRHNAPGEFTTFIAYEYTSSGDEFENLHRNVIFNGEQAPSLPFSRLDSGNPEDLWAWMEKQRAKGFDSIAIPHNSNGSNGEMFKLLDYSGAPLTDDYAQMRMRNEPLVEITQVKGTSDTHPSLSPNDEWANFEIMPYRIATDIRSDVNGSYVRQAWGNGMKLEQKQGFNPFKFGIIGASDTHNASYAGDEDNYWSKVGLLDDEGVERGSVPLAEPAEDGSLYEDSYYRFWSAAGLAGVWAEENTRDAIFAAFRRKETFATSGPRIKVRFFAGYELPAISDRELINKVSQKATSMGSELSAEQDGVPSFLAWALADANSTALQRLQVIKSVVKDGEVSETVYDVACSDGGNVDSVTHRCPDNQAQVNLSDCSIDETKGAAELKTIWQDPDFDPEQRAFYYVRALENPSCRWSTWDAIRAGVKPREDLPATIQERAWSSPIWLQPITARP